MTTLSLLHLAVKPIRKFKAGLLVAALLALALMLIRLSLPASRAADSHRKAAARARSVSKPAKPGCCGDVPATLRRMIGSYYNTEGNFNSTLTLNNKGPQNIEVTPILYNPQGSRFTAPPVVVSGQSSYNVDLDALAASAGPGFKSGSFEFTYTGRLLEMGGGLRVVDATRSLIFDEQMLEPGMKFSSPQLEAVYAIPFESAEVSVIVTNTTDQPLTVNGDATFLGENGHHPIHANLGPHAQQVVSLPQGLVKKAEAGAVSLTHNGGAGALLAMIHVKEVNKGFSAAVNFSDPNKGKSAKWDGAGLRLGLIGGELLKPSIVVRNLSSSATTVTGHVPFTTTTGSTELADLPAITLAPGEFKSLDVSNPNLSRTDIATAGVELDYTGAPGKVIASAFSASLNGNQVFTVPLLDAPAMPSSTGGYPWFINGNAATVVFIKNTTAQPQYFHLDLVYPGGRWGSNLRTIPPHQTFMLDVRQVRDNQEPGVEGNTIPLNATVGHVDWSVRGPKTALIGRAQTLDPIAGLASSYACVCNCPADFYASRVIPNSVSGFIGDTSLFFAQEQDANCFGTPGSFYSWYSMVDWASEDVNVAYINPDGLATARGVGNTFVDAQFSALTYSWDPFYQVCNSEPVTALCSGGYEVQVCPVPVNFRQDGQATTSGKDMIIKYKWDSSTGNLADLSNVTIGERVDYPSNNCNVGNKYCWPSPPWALSATTANPTIINSTSDGSISGVLTDTHASNAFSSTLQAAGFTASQVYRYRTSCANHGDWVILKGPMDIVRQVQQQSGQWKYTISKDGNSKTFNLP